MIFKSEYVKEMIYQLQKCIYQLDQKIRHDVDKQNKMNYESDGLSRSPIDVSGLVAIGTILLELDYRAAPE